MFSILKKFKDGLKKTASGALNSITSLFSKKIDQSDIDTIEETLYGADFGFETTSEIIDAIKSEYKKNKELRGKEAAQIGADVLCKILEGAQGELIKSQDDNPTVICLVGVNGAGKTTTSAKLSHLMQANGDNVVLGACDTFRAAANEQIREWANRLNVKLVESHHGADSAATAFDAWQSAKAKNAQWLVLDTAGRLHTKDNLMGELGKIRRVIAKNDSTAPHNSIIVLDGSLGSNSIEQALAFHKVFPLTGVIITKLDGTSKGGSIAGIYRKLKLPILYIGLGEQPDDLQPFDVKAYADTIFSLNEN